MNAQKLLLSTASFFAILELTAPGSANVAPAMGRPTVGLPTRIKSSSATPMRRPIAREVRVGRSNITIIGPSGCGSNSSESFIGGGDYNYAGGDDSSVVEGDDNQSCDWATGIGGGERNTIGGNDDSFSSYTYIAGGSQNFIEGRESFMGSGFNNLIGSPKGQVGVYASAIATGEDNDVAAGFSFIGAGSNNMIIDTSHSVISGGFENVISGNGNIDTGSSGDSIIGSGVNNSISGSYSVIDGGYNNSVTGYYSMIASGLQNTVSGEYSSVTGGWLNTVSGIQSIVGGGYGNVASGKDATIPGGADNIASGPNSFAAGTHASAATPGAFVWSDTAVTTALTSTVANEFLARATGGFYFYSSTKGVGVKLAPGSGSWSTMSDRNVKNNVQAVDPAKVLAELDAVPVSEWSYNSEGSVRHLGPMAQDFKAAFNLGEDDKTISTVDEEGVALAAIKALKAENDAKDRQISELRNAHLEDEARLSNLESRLDAIEARTR